MMPVDIWTLQLHYISPLPGSPVVAPGTWVLSGLWTRDACAEFFEQQAADCDWSMFREQLKLAAVLMRAYPDDKLNAEIEFQAAGADRDWHPWTQVKGEAAIGVVPWRKKPLVLNIYWEHGYTQ